MKDDIKYELCLTYLIFYLVEIKYGLKFCDPVKPASSHPFEGGQV